MRHQSFSRTEYRCAGTQRGLVLFFALIALVAMSLAALALVRSVDTSTLISGNLAFRQAATTSADGGVENSVAVMTAMQAANDALATPKNVYLGATQIFNVTNGDVFVWPNVWPAIADALGFASGEHVPMTTAAILTALSSSACAVSPIRSFPNRIACSAAPPPTTAGKPFPCLRKSVRDRVVPLPGNRPSTA